MAFDPFPHRYTATAAGRPEGADDVRSPGLDSLAMAAPAEFDGPGDCWSPETLIAATVAECLVLTFKSVARASKLPWTSLTCEAVGTLDRVDRVTSFTRFDLTARLVLPEGEDPDKARRVLEKAEQICLITNSLRSEVHLDVTVAVGA